MSFSLHIWGERACFRRPEFARDLVTYDAMTPLAARRAFEAIYSARSIRWEIQRIVVLKQIRPKWAILAEGEPGSDPQRIQILEDVGYVITADCVLTGAAKEGESTKPHAETFRRKAGSKKGTRQPYLGLAQFTADYRLLRHSDEEMPASELQGSGVRDLGWMIAEARGEGRGLPVFVRATLVDGIIELAPFTADRIAS